MSMQKKEEVMLTQDMSCTVDAYFTVKPGQQEAFEQLADRFVEKTRNESGIRYYGWSFNSDEAHCRQGYQSAEGFLEHANNVMDLFQEALTISDCTRLAIHGPDDELAKLRVPMADIGLLEYFGLRDGFRR
jgi:quinol monooxygenase YgiN